MLGRSLCNCVPRLPDSSKKNTTAYNQKHGILLITINTVPSTMASNIGHVKWYDQSKNYGFIVNLDNPHDGDVFVHRKDLSLRHGDPHVIPSLCTGEYVEFELGASDVNDTGHRAVNVRGIRGGPLLCEMGRVQFMNYTRVNFQGDVEKKGKVPL